MLSNIYRRLGPFYRDQHGSNVVEFAVFLPIFLILVFGIIDFGHAWYMRQLMVNASREGARYGTRFQTVGTLFFRWWTRPNLTNLNPLWPLYLSGFWRSWMAEVIKASEEK
jgi:hypothetical protein